MGMLGGVRLRRSKYVGLGWRRNSLDGKGSKYMSK